MIIMDKATEFYDWFHNLTPAEIKRMADNESNEDKRLFLYDLLNSRLREVQKPIIEGKFVL